MRRTPRGCWSRRAICLAMNSCPCTASAPLATRWLFWSAGRISTASAANRAMMAMTTIISTRVNDGRRLGTARPAGTGDRRETRMPRDLLLVQRGEAEVEDVVGAGVRPVVLAVGAERHDH